MPLVLILAGLLCAAVTDVTGMVVDQSGGTLAGATVTIEKPAGERVSGTTDITGKFHFPGLPPGVYQIRIEHAGFKTLNRRIEIGVSASALRFVLEIAPLHQELTIRNQGARLSGEAAENADVVILDRRTLTRLPMLGNDIVGVASQFLDQGAVGASGVSIVVDGVETQRIGVSASAIQEVRINQNPYSAEFERPGRGRIEIITEPAAAEFHGSAEFVFRDSTLAARNPFAAVRPPEQRRIFEGHLTGPVGHSKKTRFLFTANREEQDLQSVVYARTPAGLVRENSAHPLRSTEFSINLTRQLTDRQSLVLRYEPSRDSSDGDGVGGFVLPEAGYRSRAREDELFLDHTASVTPALVSQFRLRLGRETQLRASNLPGVRRITVGDAFTGGGAQSDRLQTESRLLFNETVSWTRGKHFVKAGVTVPGFRRWGLTDRTNLEGTFSFASLDDFSAGRPFLFEVQRGNPHLHFWEKAFGLFVQDEFKPRPNLSVSAGLRYDWQNYLADGNNLAPRLAVAFSPDRNRKTVLRAGAGIFYERTGHATIADLLRFDGLHLQQLILTNPAYPDPLWAGAALQSYPISKTTFAPDLRSPYLIQYSAGVEHQFRKSLVATVHYTGLTGIKLFRSRDANAPLPPAYLERPIPGTGVLRVVESAGRMQSHALDVSLRGSITKTINGTVQYTVGRTYNNTGGIGWFPADSNDLRGEWARAGFDVRHRLRMLATADAGDLFELGAVFSLSSGQPYTITTGRDDNQDGRVSDRPPGVPRNTQQGYGLANLDIRVSREFKLSSSDQEDAPGLEASIEAFNVFNRVNYTTVVGNLSSPFYGQPVTSRPARRLQLRFEFHF